MPLLFSPRAWLQLGGALLLALLAVLGTNTWRAHRQNQRSRAEQRVDTATPIVLAYQDSLAQARRQLAARDTSVATVVTRWRERPAPPAMAPPTVEDVTSGRVPLDSLAAVARHQHGELVSLTARGDSMAAACTLLRRDCAAVAQRAEQLQAAFDSLVAAQRAVFRAPAPRRRWGLGCTGGYGAVASAGTVHVGPGATCGLAFSF